MALPRTQHLASVALPAAGAYLAANATTSGGAAAYTPVEVKPHVQRLLFELSYTPASGTGTPKVYVALLTASGSELRSLVGDPPTLEEIVLPVSPSGVGEVWIYPIPYKVDPGVIGVRLVVGESGDTGSPGTVSAEVSFGYGS